MSSHGDVKLCSIVSRSEGLSIQPLDTELVMADLATGEYYGLESSGRRIWELLTQPTSLDNVCAQLTREYKVDRGQCEEEVAAFVHQLHRAGLVRLS